MTVEDEYWLIGFTEGEGSFSWKWRKHRKQQYPHFSIANTDLTALKKAQEILGVGRIVPVSRRTDDGYNRRPCWQLYVEDRRGFERVREFFKGRLKSAYKQEQFGKFEKMLDTCYRTPEEISEVRRRGIKARWEDPNWRTKQVAILQSPAYRAKMREAHLGPGPRLAREQSQFWTKSPAWRKAHPEWTE